MQKKVVEQKLIAARNEQEDTRAETRCIQRFRPLSTQALRTLELRDLNPVYTSWSALNYYIYIYIR